VGEEHGGEVRRIDLGSRFEKWTAGAVVLRLVGGDGAAIWKVSRCGRMVGEGCWLEGWRLWVSLEVGPVNAAKSIFKLFHDPGYFQIGGSPLCTAENVEILFLHH
jgi:hypothetical protein